MQNSLSCFLVAKGLIFLEGCDINHGEAVDEIRRRRYVLSPQGLYGINTKCCMLSSRRRWGEYTLARDAMLRGAQITSSGLCPLITCQSFGLDKKLSNPIGLLNFLRVLTKKMPTYLRCYLPLFAFLFAIRSSQKSAWVIYISYSCL